MLLKRIGSCISILSKSVCLQGIGIHSGRPAKVEINNGIHGMGFRVKITGGLNDHEYFNISPSLIKCRDRRTSIKINTFEIQTLEHLIASLAFLNIRDVNICMKRGYEIPAYDGSAWQIARTLMKSGLIERKNDLKRFAFLRGFSKQFINSNYRVLPSDVFSIQIALDFPNETKILKFCETDMDKYIPILRSRSFIFLQDIHNLHLNQLGLGISDQNCIFINEKNISRDILDNCLRHKILDFIGDIALFFNEVPCGAFILNNPHHRYNIEFFRRYCENNYPMFCL